MAVTPPAAKLEDDGEQFFPVYLISPLDVMELDPPAPRPGDEADVESEGGRVRSQSRTPKDQEAGNIKPKKPIEIPDDNDSGDEDEDEDEDDGGDEETFAVEKVLNHRIAKKSNVETLQTRRVYAS